MNTSRERKISMTKSLDDTVRESLLKSSEFRQVFLQGVVSDLLTGDVDSAKSMIRRYIVATVGYSTLEHDLLLSEGSLCRAFEPGGQPLASVLFKVIAELERREGITFDVVRRAA